MKLVTLQTVTAEVREEVVNGKTYLVAPVVAVRAGVLNSALLTADELHKVLPVQWDDIPIPVGHPMRGDEPISSTDIAVIEQNVCGRFYHAYYDGDKLKGELWVDVERALEMGGEAEKALRTLQAGDPLEVSTGYICDEEERPGTWNGIPYDVVQHNIRPDHIALLPSAIGACSWADGCGAPRINEREQTMLTVQLREGESFEDRTRALETALREQYMPADGGFLYVSDLYEDAVVYNLRSEDGKTDAYFRVGYGFSGKTIVFSGQPMKVDRKVTYTPLAANIRSAARTPSYSGKESTSWEGPTLSDMIDGYVKHTGGDRPESSRVADLPGAVKSWIASKTLLGEASAEDTRNLMFFPVVNPSTDKLNENALRAVIGGRGAQADIPAAAKKSAQDKARALLEKEFTMATQSANCEKSILQKIGAFFRTLGVNTMDREEMVKTLQERGVAEDLYKDLGDGQLAWMVEHSEPAESAEPAAEPAAPAVEPAQPQAESGANMIEGAAPIGPLDEPLQISASIDGDTEIDGVKFSEIAALVKNQKAEDTEKRNSLVARLVANERCTVSKETLEGASIEMLAQLVANFEPGSYVGAGVPRGSGSEIPQAPAILLAKKESE